MSTSNATSIKSRSLLKSPQIKDELAEDGLACLEKLDRASPDLWPEKIPGITDFIAMSDQPIHTPASQWALGLSPDDINAMTQLSQLPVRALATEIKNMQDDSFQLGVNEAKEMTRGKYMGIFSNMRKK